MDLLQSANDIWNWVQASPLESTGVVAAAAGTLGTAVLSLLRRPRPSSQKRSGSYFAKDDLLTPPTTRPAYSDRMAYVMAELADLAYFEFEGTGGAILDAVEHVQELSSKDSKEIKTFLDLFAQKVMSGRDLNLGFLEKILEVAGFKLIDTINIKETQGFACKCVRKDEPPYLVIAFRGTEKKISDWLTDARAVPTILGKGKVHSGFYQAFSKDKDADENTVREKVEQIMQSAEAKDQNGEAIPVFFTGHSLGGALALLATRLTASDMVGACYTFGAPRIANYEFFDVLENDEIGSLGKLKTPVYRVVNSSDIVPRVPPGAGWVILINLVKVLTWVTRWLPPVVSSMFERLEGIVDKLNGYRHIGDMRYLTDVAENNFDKVKLLSNPPAIDRIMWMWQHLAAGFFVPVSSHSMALYRKKLLSVASQRN